MPQIGWGVAFGAGFLIGALVVFVITWGERSRSRRIAADLLAQSQAERVRDVEAVIARVKESFAAISYDALAKNTEQFLQIANEKMKSQTELGEQTLETKKRLIDQTLETINKEIIKVQEVVTQLEKDREQKFGELNNQLKVAAEQTAKLQDTAGQLHAALANTKVRGQWGERMAEDVLRLSGFIEGVNYLKQQISTTGNRPDYTFLLPKDLKVNMDVKFPLDNYLEFLQAEDPTVKESYKTAFLRDVRLRIKEVTGRDYINPEEQTVDYVLVFIPNEQVYSFINEMDGGIIDEALKNRVILCSPLTLYAFLAVIRKAVENFNLERTTSQIIFLLDDFHKQWDAFCGTLEKMGRRIDDARNEFQALISTRKNQLDKPLRRIDALRREKNLPIETFELEVAPGTDTEDGPIAAQED